MKLHKLLLSLVLLIITLCLYWRTGTHGFCLFDDGEYIVNNAVVLKGITFEGISWAFTSFHTGNWIPVTWLSLMLDAQISGANASGYHLVNASLHALNAVLVFILLTQLTAALWRSFAVALLFAIHPLHVESVAWISERKDLLCALFFFLTLLAWVRYARKQTPLRYLCVLSLFVLGLMSKPMLVTLPFILVLLDWWPLGRFDAQRRPARIFVEKIPFLGISIGFSFVTLLAQRQAGAMGTFVIPSLMLRLTNAITSYGVYLRKMVWPSDLVILYPFPTFISWWQSAAWAILLVVATLVFFRMRGRYPYLIAGWLWYLVMLVPVSGVVQVGVQAMADRYTYLPLLGPFIMISWGAADAATGHARKTALIAAVAVAGFLSFATWRQIGFWKSDIVLFSRALEVSPANPTAYANFCNAHLNEGIILRERGNLDEALKHFTIAASRSTGDVAAMAHNNLGLIYALRGKNAEAEREFVTSLQYDSTYAEPYHNMGLLHLKEDRIREAVVCFSEAVRLNPGDVKARRYLQEISLRSEKPLAGQLQQ